MPRFLLIHNINKEKQNVTGNYFIDHCGVDAYRCISYLATQQIMGLWPERRGRTNIAYPDHFAVVRKTVNV
uniref:Uncharacterized protein n=1 Tax=mine drainage metagenome TaxID=410659 RepID=E6QT80_9ZZZZ